MIKKGVFLISIPMAYFGYKYSNKWNKVFNVEEEFRNVEDKRKFLYDIHSNNFEKIIFNS